MNLNHYNKIVQKSLVKSNSNNLYDMNNNKNVWDVFQETSNELIPVLDATLGLVSTREAVEFLKTKTGEQRINRTTLGKVLKDGKLRSLNGKMYIQELAELKRLFITLDVLKDLNHIVEAEDIGNNRKYYAVVNLTQTKKGKTRVDQEMMAVSEYITSPFAQEFAKKMQSLKVS